MLKWKQFLHNEEVLKAQNRKKWLIEVLTAYEGSLKRAAVKVGVDRANLWRLLRVNQIDPNEYRPEEKRIHGKKEVRCAHCLNPRCDCDFIESE